jgi:hypothetical protein
VLAAVLAPTGPTAIGALVGHDHEGPWGFAFVAVAVAVAAPPDRPEVELAVTSM